MNFQRSIAELRDEFKDEMISLFQGANIRIYSELLWGSFEEKVYPNTVSWYGFYKRMFPIIAAVDSKDIPCLYQLLKKNKMQNIIILHCMDFHSIYFEHYSGLPGIVISPKKTFISLHRSILNQSRDAKIIYQIQNNAHKKGINNLCKIDYISSRVLWVIENMVSADKLNIKEKKYMIRKYNNSQKEFQQLYLNYQFHEKTRNEGENVYNHIEKFSRVYYWAIRIISELAPKIELTLHDTGSQFAHFPLLLNWLASRELLPVKIKRILASDINIVGKFFAEQYLKTRNIKQYINFIEIDICNDDAEIKDFDVTTIIDVLEHLHDDVTSFRVLNKLWKRTGYLLIAHVPFEKTANPAWDHYITFDPLKIRDWANKLKNTLFLSDVIFETDGKSLLEHGFLILKRHNRF